MKEPFFNEKVIITLFRRPNRRILAISFSNRQTLLIPAKLTFNKIFLHPYFININLYKNRGAQSNLKVFWFLKEHVNCSQICSFSKYPWSFKNASSLFYKRWLAFLSRWSPWANGLLQRFGELMDGIRK